MFRTVLLAIAFASVALAPVHAESTADKAVADIIKAQAKLHSLQSLTADVTMTAGENGNEATERGLVKLLKPNYLWLDVGQGKHRNYHISDGKDYCVNDKKDKWTTVKANAHGDNFRNDLMIWSDFYVFYATTNAKQMLSNRTVTIDHKRIDGEPCEVITAKYEGPKPGTMTITIAADGLIHRFAIDAGPQHMEETWANLKLNPPLKPAEFKPKY